MFCITTREKDLDIIESLEYVPVGLGNKITSNKFLQDKTFKNIADKNPFYGEYTFHYWLWKNYLKNLNNQWIGFCQYRKFWSHKSKLDDISYKNFKENILKEIPFQDKNIDSVIGEPLYINKIKVSKLLKKNIKKVLTNPSFLFNKNKRNIKFHFDLMHGEGNLDKAISLLKHEDKKDFTYFVNTEVSFNPHNMFICRSTDILQKYYNSVFPWLKKCEEVFGFDLKGYGLKRIYGFLAERYLSFWFKKYTNFKTLPIIFKDISDFY